MKISISLTLEEIYTGVNKKVKMSRDDVIKYQILTHCFLNDIQISNSDNILNFADDLVISTKVMGKLVLDENVNSLNYNIETVNKIVYIRSCHEIILNFPCPFCKDSI